MDSAKVQGYQLQSLSFLALYVPLHSCLESPGFAAHPKINYSSELGRGKVAVFIRWSSAKFFSLLSRSIVSFQTSLTPLWF